VVYASSSSALATGSALTFDGSTTLTLVTANTTATVAKFRATNYGNLGTTYISLGTQYDDGTSRIGSLNPTGNQSALVFETNTSASGVWQEGMRLTNSSLYTASGVALIVGGSSAVNVASGRGNITIDGSSNSILNFAVGGVAKSYLFQNGGNFIITNTASAGGYLGFENNGSERIRITSTGRVGIDTNDPDSTLHVGGAGTLRVGPSSIGTDSIAGIYFSGIPNSASGYSIHKTTGAWTGPDYQQLLLDWDTGIVINGGSAYGKSGTVLQPNGGNVGIGTSSPTTKLYVTTSAASTAVAAFFNTDTSNGNGVFIRAGGANSGKYALAIENAASSSLLLLDSTGGLKTKNTIGVGDATPSTSGAGITFPATQNASSNANTLDDYEEGTYNPTDVSGAGLTLTNNTSIYIKIGNMVWFALDVTFPSTANTADLCISLPFPTGYDAGGSIGYTTYVPTIPTFVQISSGAGGVRLQANGGTSVKNVAMSTNRIQISGCYNA
jgi:hypothetical protein